MLRILEKLLPEIDGISLEDTTKGKDVISVQLATTKRGCFCPLCNDFCNRIHSRYNWCIADLPWSIFTVKIELQSRKFFCDNDDCIRKIFTERFKKTLLLYARKIARLKNTMEEIRFAVGGNAGSFLAKKLGINVSSSTLLRATHDFSIGSYETPRVLGVDDWAFKKGVV